jgi:hypothetical protein
MIVMRGKALARKGGRTLHEYYRDVVDVVGKD